MKNKIFKNRMWGVLIICFYFNGIDAQWFATKEMEKAYSFLENQECTTCNHFKEDHVYNEKLLSTNIAIYKRREEIWKGHISFLMEPFAGNVDTVVYKKKKDRRKQVHRRHEWYKKRDNRLPGFFEINYCNFLKPIFESNNTILVTEYFKNLQEYKFSNRQMYEVLSCLDLTSKQKELLLSQKNIGLRARARLGDSIAEQKIIETFTRYFSAEYVNMGQKNYPYNELSNACYDMFFVDSKHVWDTFFYYLSSEIAVLDFWKNDGGEEYVVYKNLAYNLLEAHGYFFYNEINFFQHYVYSSEELMEWHKLEKDYLILEILAEYLGYKHNKEFEFKEFKTNYLKLYEESKYPNLPKKILGK